MPGGLLVLTRSTTSTASITVELAGDGVGDARELLLLLLEILGRSGGTILFEPVSGFLDCFQDLGRYTNVSGDVPKKKVKQVT